MTDTASTIYAEHYFNYLVQRSFLQKLIRKMYLRDIRKYCTGRTIDFGCGVGELLRSLPKGSVGFEINKIAVDYCNSTGVVVFLYKPEEDRYQLGDVAEGCFDSFTINHVLEHTENTAWVIRQLFAACHRLQIKRIVITVPGIKGYDSDKTHRTFVDHNFLEANGLVKNDFYELKHRKYFPFNFKTVSKFFVHNELRLIFDRVNG